MTDDHIRQTIQTYDNTADEYIRKAARYAPVPEREAFVSLIPSSGTILDAGCGSGRDANFFAQRGRNVIGIDLSEALLAYARSHAVPGSSFRYMDLRHIDVVPGSFDGVWACASLLHLRRKEIAPVLRGFFDILRDGGILFVLMKEGKGESVTGSSTVSDGTRFFTYVTQDEITSAIGTAGFTVFNSQRWDQQERHPERPHEIWISVFARKHA